MARLTPHAEAEVKEMLEAIGGETLDELVADVAPTHEARVDLRPRR